MVEQCSAGCPNNGNFPGLTYRSQSASSSNSADNKELSYSWRASLSYVTGAHSLKVGVTGNLMNSNSLANLAPNALIYRVEQAGVPNQLTMVVLQLQYQFLGAERRGTTSRTEWTRKRLTPSGALRYDRACELVPATAGGPGDLPSESARVSAHNWRRCLQ